MYTSEVGMTQSLLKKFLACPRACKYYLEGYRKIGLKKPMWFGSLMHYILHIWKSQLVVGNTECQPEDVLSSPLLEAYMEEQMLEFPEDVEEINKLRAVGSALLYSYAAQYAEEMKQQKWIASEIQFKEAFRGHILRGMADGIVECADGLYIIDHKFKGRQSASMASLLSRDFQVEFYYTALIQAGYDIKGFIYDVIRPPQIKPRKTETHEAYTARLLGDTLERPEFYFKRYNITFKQNELQEMRFNLLKLLDRFKTWIDMGMDDVYYSTGCAMSGGGECPYLSMCTTGDDLGYTKVETFFEELPKEKGVDNGR